MSCIFDRSGFQELIKRDIKDFCRRAQCSRQQAHRYLNEDALPSVPTLEEIAKGFGINPAIFFIEEPKQLVGSN